MICLDQEMRPEELLASRTARTGKRKRRSRPKD